MISKLALNISNSIAVPVYVAPEDIQLGQVVFQHFVHEEFEHEGVPDADLFPNQGEPNANDIIDENFAVAHSFALEGVGELSLPEGYNNNAVISKIGLNIRELANEFAQSRQREAIRREADEVDLRALTRDHFWTLLEEVFRHGITKENLIALFFFCSDVLIRCVKSKLREIGLNLFRWSMNYIADRVVRWVVEHGGWERCLRKAYDFRYVIAAASILSIAAIVYVSTRK